MKCIGAAPMAAASDVGAAAELLKDKFGFQDDWQFGDPVEWIGLKLGDAGLYLCEDAELVKAVVAAGCYQEIFLWVDGIESWYEDHERRGARILRPLEDKPWRVRQYSAEGPAGYTLKFAQAI